MKHLIVIILLARIVFSQSGENQTFKLQDGTVIVGLVIEETETAFIIQTKYGSVTLNKDELVRTEYEIKLKTGETFSGIKLSETDIIIKLDTKLGVLDIEKSDILDMKESGQVTKAGEKKAGPTTTSYRRAYSLSDMLFGTGTRGSSEKDIEFAMGEERLIDTFFDPTAYVLDDGTLYLSGLSFAFGLSDKLQLSSRWFDFFWGNFNIRPKYMLFHKGNWEKESALAIGGHFHTYWKPNKVVWKTGNVDVISKRNDIWDDDREWISVPDTTINYNYGGYFPLGSDIKGSTNHCSDCDNDGLLDVVETDDLDFMVEFFTTYTFSKARKGMRGRVSSTVGAMVQIPMSNRYKWSSGETIIPYRIFWGTDVDITPQLKMVGEAFYDPFFLDLNHRTDDDDCDFPSECIFGSNYTYKTSETNEITEDDFHSVRPIHFDFGFMYAVNEHFRFGIHTQPYIISFYWKF